MAQHSKLELGSGSKNWARSTSTKSISPTANRDQISTIFLSRSLRNFEPHFNDESDADADADADVLSLDPDLKEADLCFCVSSDSDLSLFRISSSLMINSSLEAFVLLSGLFSPLSRSSLSPDTGQTKPSPRSVPNKNQHQDLDLIFGPVEAVFLCFAYKHTCVQVYSTWRRDYLSLAKFYRPPLGTLFSRLK